MFGAFIVGSLAVFLTYLTRDKQNGAGLKMAFFVIFVFLALRYDYGNDYMGYLNGYNEITTYTTIFFTDVRWEPGWNFLHVLFKPFGFFAMIAFTSLATCVVFYWFIRSYVPAGYQWLAVFLYCFDPYQMLVCASAMRQNVAILFFLVATKFLNKKRFLIYLLLTGVGATFHKSAMLLPPLVLLAFINFKINKLIAVVIGLIYPLMFFFGETIFSHMVPFVGEYFPKYSTAYLHEGGSKFGTGLGFLYSMFQMSAILYFAGFELNPHTETSEDDHDMEFAPSPEESGLMPIDQNAAFLNTAARRILFKLAIMTFLFTPLGMQVQMVGRINMYFMPVMIAVFPIILFTTKDKFFHLIFLSSLMAITLFLFWTFFHTPLWRDKFGTYHTIFSAPQWY